MPFVRLLHSIIALAHCDRLLHSERDALYYYPELEVSCLPGRVLIAPRSGLKSPKPQFYTLAISNLIILPNLDLRKPCDVCVLGRMIGR